QRPDGLLLLGTQVVGGRVWGGGVLPEVPHRLLLLGTQVVGGRVRLWRALRQRLRRLADRGSDRTRTAYQDRTDADATDDQPGRERAGPEPPRRDSLDQCPKLQREGSEGVHGVLLI